MDGSNFTYSEDRLEEVLAYAAFFVNEEVDFTTTYTVNVNNFNIDPDPTSTSDGNLLITLMVLKAASIIVCGEARSAAGQAIKVVDGPSSVDAGGIYKSKSELCNQLRDDYEKAAFKVSIGDLSGGEAVLTPYTQENI